MTSRIWCLPTAIFFHFEEALLVPATFLDEVFVLRKMVALWDLRLATVANVSRSVPVLERGV